MSMNVDPPDTGTVIYRANIARVYRVYHVCVCVCVYVSYVTVVTLPRCYDVRTLVLCYNVTSPPSTEEGTCLDMPLG